jgi:glycosyltransferase involved in cell wall biosynthesis
MDKNYGNSSVDGYNIIYFNDGIKLFGNSISLKFILLLIQELKKKKYDIIHAHSHLFFTTNVCALLRKVNSTPLIITTHGLIGQTVPVWLQWIFLRTVGKLTFQAADKIISYTYHEKDMLVHLGIDSEKIAVIHNGIDINFFYPIDNHMEFKTILWIGRYTPGKGVEYLIEAFHQFHQRYPEYTLLMVGRGPKKDEIARMIQEHGLDSSIQLLDFIPNAELPNLYRKSSIFVLPSLEEGVPRTILEAMACGVPVVCTELPQLVDIVAGSGILVPVRDSEALAEALIQIVTDPDRARELGENGRERVVADFSWDDTVNQTLKLYQEVIQSMREKNIEQESHNASPDSVPTYGRTGK